jgi:hypothetical protein
MKSFVSLALLLALVCVPQGIQAQTYGSRSHTVTVNVATITNLAVSSMSVSLTIGLAQVTAGQNLMGPVVNTSTSLLWGINSSLKKVTVRTSLAGPKYTLNIVATSPTTGSPAAEATLSTTDKDFMTNVGRSSGSCTIQYAGYAFASAGTGTDSHTVTFTIANQ